MSESSSASLSDPLSRIAELPGVNDAIDETRTLVDRLRDHRILRRRSNDVSLESSLRGACASAALEGAEVSMDEIREGHVYDTRIKGALRIGGELGGLVDTWPKAPRQTLARLHTLAAADAVSEEALGRPRLEGERIEDPLELVGCWLLLELWVWELLLLLLFDFFFDELELSARDLLLKGWL